MLGDGFLSYVRLFLIFRLRGRSWFEYAYLVGDLFYSQFFFYQDKTISKRKMYEVLCF